MSVFVFPQVQTVRMNVLVVGFLRMKLNNGFVIAPKQFFDPAHFFPCRTIISLGNRNMFPFRSIVDFSAGNDPERVAPVRDHEKPATSLAFSKRGMHAAIWFKFGCVFSH